MATEQDILDKLNTTFPGFTSAMKTPLNTVGISDATFYGAFRKYIIRPYIDVLDDVQNNLNASNAAVSNLNFVVGEANRNSSYFRADWLRNPLGQTTSLADQLSQAWSVNQQGQIVFNSAPADSLSSFPFATPSSTWVRRLSAAGSVSSAALCTTLSAELMWRMIYDKRNIDNRVSSLNTRVASISARLTALRVSISNVPTGGGAATTDANEAIRRLGFSNGQSLNSLINAATIVTLANGQLQSIGKFLQRCARATDGGRINILSEACAEDDHNDFRGLNEALRGALYQNPNGNAQVLHGFRTLVPLHQDNLPEV